MNQQLFFEKQRFTQWWLWLILILLNILFGIALYEQYTEHKIFGAKPMSDTGLFFAWAITILITLLFIVMKLETQIKPEAVYVRFFPFHFSYKKFELSALSEVYVRKYAAIYEYGGWGIRLGWFGKGNAYTVSGENGIQLEFKNGKKLLVGTQKPEIVRHILAKLVI
ncbi:hypothetical protein GV828_07620 [Flavobacterium sp. NST-5]|uniref:Bacterial Pleckstrin homology domain-containing protein n=1 Tax=Flavobacterium ichthyis TaxID=2698827 RepID=A0ABW9Z868_9FLAO|nr:hypothetical protein [Flavobacterium ichthyis]NBL65065.1 hypothetical protein [Flavobacterium ichthyis]